MGAGIARPILCKGEKMKVEIRDLTKRFPNRDKKGSEVIAVNKFNLTIPDGKLVSLLGPSGCGKSTMLYMICGLLAPTEGKIYFGEDDVTNVPPENKGVGLVFQNYALYPHLTVKQNIMFPLQNLKGAAKLSREQMNEKVLEAAKVVQIENYLNRKPAQLSGGQQQRVAIARALVKTPNVLLLDEPLSNLDARLRLATREELSRIQKETGITTIFVTHDQEEAMSISDMIVVMKDGVFQQSGVPQDVYDDPDNLFVAKFLGTPPINVFDGKVVDEVLYIGRDSVMDVPGVGNKDVFVGVRPEGFIPLDQGNNEKHVFTCALEKKEVMGRDVSVVCSHPSYTGERFRAIVDADILKENSHVSTDSNNVNKPSISFALKPGKTLMFDKATEERIRYGKN